MDPVYIRGQEGLDNHKLTLPFLLSVLGLLVMVVQLMSLGLRELMLGLLVLEMLVRLILILVAAALVLVVAAARLPVDNIVAAALHHHRSSYPHLVFHGSRNILAANNKR